MPKVTAKATYCGHILQAETDLNRQGEWTARCVVEGSHFKGTIMLHDSFRSPSAALDAIFTAARRSVDERRSLGQAQR
jgi:hypothetical protein